MLRLPCQPHSAESCMNVASTAACSYNRNAAARTQPKRRSAVLHSLPETNGYQPVEGKPSPQKLSRPAYEFDTHQGAIDSSDDEEPEFDFLGESTSGNLQLVQPGTAHELILEENFLGLDDVSSVRNVSVSNLRQATKAVLDDMGIASSQYPEGLSERAIFCSRTLNLRAIQALGYDMDYTLVNYDVNAWEGRAYEYGLAYLRDAGCNVDGLTFDPDLVIRGLLIDRKLGNLVKADRFGYVKRAMHGTRMFSWAELRETYGRELVVLRDGGRWQFLNTLFSVSEACLYMQMVDRNDQGAFESLPSANSYEGLHNLVAKALFRTHVEGKLKAEIIKDPARFVERDPAMARTLIDQREAGKTLLLITNSDLEYSAAVMSYSYDCFLPEGKSWRDLFDLVIVQAQKPDFFTGNRGLFEIVTVDGLMRPCYKAKRGGLYFGGSAKMVEDALGFEGDEILDHIYTDAALAKMNFRWRTALIVRELEDEVRALSRGRAFRDELKELMQKKEIIGDLLNQLRLIRQRAAFEGMPSGIERGHINAVLAQLLLLSEHLDGIIGPMLEQDGQYFSERWGYLSRAGLNDKSQFTRQIEKYADIYTSRVSNFLRYTAFQIRASEAEDVPLNGLQYFRSPSQSLAHDRSSNRLYPGSSATTATSGDPGSNGSLVQE